MAVLSGSSIVVEERSRIDSLKQKGYGELKNGKLVLDSKEAMYLLEKKKISLKDRKGKKVSKKSFEKEALKEKNFLEKYAVYKDLRERGLVTKTGFKFGFDFRVYPRGFKAGEAHSQWVIHVAKQSEKFSLPETSRMVRMSGNLKTELMIAVVDSEHDVNYYKISRIVP